MSAPARSTAQGLRLPTRSATCEGSPKMPLPRMELTVRATRLQRPMARMRDWLEEVSDAVGGTASLYHKLRCSWQCVRSRQRVTLEQSRNALRFSQDTAM